MAGRKISLTIGFKKASNDVGIGNVKLKVQLRNTNGTAITPVYEFYANANGEFAQAVTPIIDLGYTGRKIQIWTDASSAGASNGQYRSITVSNVVSFVE